MAKASDNIFPKLIESMNTSDQSAPSDSSWKIYAKASGIFARSSNAVVGPFGAASTSVVSAVLCTNSATQSLTNATDVAITFDTETYDTDAYHSTGANTSRLVAPFTGKYRIDGIVQFNAGTGLERRLTIKKNGSTVLWLVRLGPINSADTHFQEIHTPPIQLTATDYVELYAQQDSGGSLNSNNTLGTPQFGMTFLGT